MMTTPPTTTATLEAPTATARKSDSKTSPPEGATPDSNTPEATTPESVTPESTTPEDTIPSAKAASEPAKPEQVVAPVSEASKPSGRRGRRLLAGLKFLFVLIVLAAIAVAAVIGWPTVRDRIYNDVDANTAEIRSMTAQLAEADSTIAGLQEQLDTLNDRQAAVPTRLDELTIGVEGITTGQAEIDARLDELNTSIATLDATVAEFDGRLTGLDTALVAGDLRVTDQLDVARVTELLSRARLFLYQANYGLAVDDLRLAHSILDKVDPNSGAVEPALREAALARISLAIAALPDRPVLAADDLDIAWQLLLDDAAEPRVASSPPVPAIASPVTPAADAAVEPVPTDSVPEPAAGSGG